MAGHRNRLTIGSAVLAILTLIASACSAKNDPKSEGDIEIRFWHVFAGERETWIKDAVAKYNASHPGVVVKPESKGAYDALYDAVLLGAKNKTAPEIAQVVVTYVASARESGAFKVVGDIDTDQKIKPDAYLAPVIGQLTADGKLTSVPFAHSGPMLFYDKGMFTAAGLDPNKPPRTYEEILTACEEIVVRKKVAPTCIGIPWAAWFLENFMAEQGAPLLNNGNGRDSRATEATLDTPEAVAAATFWRTLRQKGFYRHSKEAYTFERQLLQQKTAAMTVTSTADAGFFRDAFAKDNRQLGAGYFPAPAGASASGTTLGGGSLWVTAGHDKRREQAALDFLAWFTSPEMSAEWHKKTGYFPANRAAEDRLNQEGWFDKNPAFRVALDQLKATVAGPATKGPLHGAMPEVSEAYMKALEQIVLGNADPAGALGKADTDATAAIKRYNDLHGK